METTCVRPVGSSLQTEIKTRERETRERETQGDNWMRSTKAPVWHHLCTCWVWKPALQTFTAKSNCLNNWKRIDWERNRDSHRLFIEWCTTNMNGTLLGTYGRKDGGETFRQIRTEGKRSHTVHLKSIQILPFFHILLHHNLILKLFNYFIQIQWGKKSI